MKINFEFRGYEPEADTALDCSFWLTTDNLKVTVSWADGEPEEVLIYAPDDSHETYVSNDAFKHMAVLVDGEYKTLQEIFDWVSANIDSFIAEENLQWAEESVMRDELSSPGLTGRI